MIRNDSSKCVPVAINVSCNVVDLFFAYSLAFGEFQVCFTDAFDWFSIAAQFVRNHLISLYCSNIKFNGLMSGILEL